MNRETTIILWIERLEYLFDDIIFQIISTYSISLYFPCQSKSLSLLTPSSQFAPLVRKMFIK